MILCLLSDSRLRSPVTSKVSRRQSHGYFVDCKGIFIPPPPHTSYLGSKKYPSFTNRVHAEFLKKTPSSVKYCIKGNVNVCLIFPNLPNGFETGTIKTLSLITFVGMLGQAMFVFRLSNTAVYLSNSLAQQMATYVIWIVAVFMSKSQQTTIHSKTYSFG